MQLLWFYISMYLILLNVPYCQYLYWFLGSCYYLHFIVWSSVKLTVKVGPKPAAATWSFIEGFKVFFTLSLNELNHKIIQI